MTIAMSYNSELILTGSKLLQRFRSGQKDPSRRFHRVRCSRIRTRETPPLSAERCFGDFTDYGVGFSVFCRTMRRDRRWEFLQELVGNATDRQAPS